MKPALTASPNPGFDPIAATRRLRDAALHDLAEAQQALDRAHYRYVRANQQGNLFDVAPLREMQWRQAVEKVNRLRSQADDWEKLLVRLSSGPTRKC